MKTIKIKKLTMAGILFTTLSLAAYNTGFAQGQQTPGTTTSGDTKNSKNVQTPNAANREEDIQNAGSSAQVRHDRTGSLDPGHVGPQATKGGTGTPNNQMKVVKPQ